jgi:hypothetical protein
MAKKNEKMKTKGSSKTASPPKAEKNKSVKKPAPVAKSVKTTKPAKEAKITKPAQADQSVSETKAAKDSKKPKAESKKVQIETTKQAPGKVEKQKSGAAAAGDLESADPIWLELHRKHSDEKASNYDMRSAFEASTPLNHKILGWGWILSNENDRLEVVFKDGKRILISNYKK